MRDAIKMDATEVAFYSSFRAVPQIVKVAKHTATQVELVGHRRRFTRDRGKPIGAGYSGSDAYIENVEQRHHDRIAAAELHDAAKEVYDQIWKVQEARFGMKRDALRKVGEGRDGDTVAKVQEAIARMKLYAKEQYGVEVDVHVEKKA